jgi:DNA-binding NtrC family response regulator
MSAPSLPVVVLTDSFASLWEPLARAAGFAGARTVASADDLDETSACPVLVAAGGAERRVAPVLAAIETGREVVVAGALDDRHVAAAVLAAGAAEYFVLPAERDALQEWIAARAPSPLTDGGPAAPSPYDFSALVGDSPALRRALVRAARLVPHRDAPLLVTGETGTGKQLLAEAVHRNGPRGDGPFVEVNCAALPPSLLEAELFGYERGAFTDARAAKAGLFELADGGTLFLDEIGDLPLALQGKLLTALERRRTRRLGATRETTVDARVIAATHVDLGAAVREGRFRADLFFRLDVVRVHLPALRDRDDDAVRLASHLMRALARRHGVTPRAIGDRDRAAIRAHRWPGNVRELRNVVERALLCGEPLRACISPGGALPDDTGDPAASATLPRSLREVEREAAHAAVAHCGGNKSQAAVALGVSRKRLYALLADDPTVAAGPAIRRAGAPAAAAP